MKTITVEDIYIELEPIFDEIESGYERRLKVYKLLNNLLPKWEGNERQKTMNPKEKLCPAQDYKNVCQVTGYCEYCPFYIDGSCKGCKINCDTYFEHDIKR